MTRNQCFHQYGGHWHFNLHSSKLWLLGAKLWMLTDDVQAQTILLNVEALWRSFGWWANKVHHPWMLFCDSTIQLILSPMHGKHPRVELKKEPSPRQHSLALLTPESSVPSQLLSALLKHWISGKNTK